MLRIPHDRGIQLQVAEQLARHLAAANVLGRLAIVQDVKRKTGKAVRLATSTQKKLHFYESFRRYFGFGDDDEEDMGVDANLRLPADDAAAYIRGLTPVTKETFDGLTAQYRKLAFTIAGTADTRLIGKVRDELANVIQQGGTTAQFDAAVAKMTSAEGVASLNAFTLDTAFQTATAKAYGQGRWEQFNDEDTMLALPFLQTVTVGDDRVRPAHEALDGFQARVDDPVWTKIFGPWDWGCRCIQVGMLESEVGDEASDPGMLRLPTLTRLELAATTYHSVV